MPNAIATTTAEHRADRARPSPEALDRFVELAVAALLAKPYGQYLSTDYAPDRPLDRIAAEAGIRAAAFPWKAATVIDAEGRLLAKVGQGQPMQVIWSPPEAAELEQRSGEP